MDYVKIKDAISSVHGATFVGLDTITEVKLKGGKKNPMQGRVKKVTVGANTMIFADVTKPVYEDMVKRRLVEEGKDPEAFSVGPRAWGTRVDNTPFIEHNGKKYLECFFVSPGKSHYLLDDAVISEDQIEGLPEKKENEESQGGLENKVVVRTYSLDSIQKMRLMGKEIE